MSQKEMKVGDKIAFKNLDAFLKEEIKKPDRITIKYLRALFSIQPGKKYKIIDVCRGCHLAWLMIGKQKVMVKFQFLKINHKPRGV